MRLRWVTIACAVFGGCEALEPAAAPPPFEVLLDAPIDAQEVAFNTPFALSGVARAPEGTVLREAQIVLSGAAFERRTIPLSGNEAEFDAELVVARDALTGSDRLPLDIVVVVTASADGRPLRSDPRGVSLVVVDDTPPTLDVELHPPAPAPPGYDAAFDSATPFTVTVRAEDNIGGLDRIVVGTPAFLGGDRSQDFDGDRAGSFAVTLSPPAHADFELVITASDVARTSNTGEKRLRIRVGDGGIDDTPPAVTFSGVDEVECGTTSTIGLSAVDDLVGVDRIVLATIDDTRTFFTTGIDASVLSVTTTIAADNMRLTYDMSATARDLVGNESDAIIARPLVVDTQGPDLASAAPATFDIEPGRAVAIALSARDACTDIDAALVTFQDGMGRQPRTQTPVGTQSLDGTLNVDVPSALCTIDPIDATIVVIDALGLPSNAITTQFSGRDTLPPEVRINTLVPGSGLLPGASLVVNVDLADPQVGVATATVTLRPQGLELPAILLREAEVFPTGRCSNTSTRTVQRSYLIPSDVRFSGPTGSIVVEVTASDASGLTTTATAAVSVITSEPPELSFVAPRAGDRVVQGTTSLVTLSARDRSHDVASVSLTAFGPASIGTAGTTSATIAVQAASATVSFALVVDSGAPPDAFVRLVATAHDTGAPVSLARVSRTVATCGVPSLSSIVPAIGPVLGDQNVRLFGAGFADGATVQIGGTPLVDVVVVSATIADARIPAGTYGAGIVDAVITNRCGGVTESDNLASAFRFVSPPTLTWIRPAALSTAQPNDIIQTTVVGRADGVSLTSVSAGLVGAIATQPTSNLVEVIDTSVTVPAIATASVTVVATAVDQLGQQTNLIRAIPIGSPTPVALNVDLARDVVSVGEVGGISVLATMTDGRTYDVSPVATIQSTTTTVATVSGVRLTGVGLGRTSIRASLGALQATKTLDVTSGLRATDGALYLSPGGATARPTLRVYQGGGSAEVTNLTMTSSDPTVAAVVQNTIEPRAAGVVTITARLTATPTIGSTFDVVVADRLDVPAGGRYAVPSGQVFSGGTIAGTVDVHRPRTLVGPWRLTIHGAGRLDVLAGGLLDARGQVGDVVGDGGFGASGSGGGGAGKRSGGAAGGFGEPPGASTPDDLPTTMGGDGGGASGGQGARADPSSAGSGGGAWGAGGNGGALTGIAIGGTGLGASFAASHGGGGGRGSGGGGGGAVLEFVVGGTLHLDGTLRVTGGTGGAHDVRTTGGGGGGGRVSIRAMATSGVGHIDVSGGAGGALAGAGVRGSGGGGGGGLVDLSAVLSPNYGFVIIVDGGRAAQSLGVTSVGTDGAAGAILR